jgi:hypothetical protein
MRESRVAPRAPTIAAVRFSIDDRAVITCPIVVARSAELYRTAPKTSPPA